MQCANYPMKLFVILRARLVLLLLLLLISILIPHPFVFVVLAWRGCVKDSDTCFYFSSVSVSVSQRPENNTSLPRPTANGKRIFHAYSIL